MKTFRPWLVVYVTTLGSLLIPELGRAAEIDTCKHFIIADLADDTLTLARQMRAQGEKRGLSVVPHERDVPAAEALSACTIAASWLGSLEAGQLSLRVIHTAEGTPVAAVDVRGSNKLGFDFMLRAAVEKAYAELGYSGFKPELARARLEQLYPSRPTYEVSKAWLAEWKPRAPIEGVWADADGVYRLAIVPASTATKGTHIATVLESASPLWKPAEIKIEFLSGTATASDPIEATFYLLNKQPLATTFAFTNKDELEATLNTPAGSQVFRLRRIAVQGR